MVVGTIGAGVPEEVLVAAGVADFEQAEFKDEVRPLILKENAARLLGLR